MAKLRFSVDSALLSELGERLVERVHTALGELIKNAYDADATRVTVTLLPRLNDEIEIMVSDNGCGMAFQDIKNYWMRIATTNKVKNDVSSIYGRPKMGAKGIGRFSCRRLGTFLELKTTAKVPKGFETTTVTFDWNDYTAGTEVTQIECPGQVQISSKGVTGTSLSIKGSNRAEWNRRSWNTLKRQMAVLVANRGSRRKGYKADPGFEIKLIAPEFEDEVLTNPREQLMNAGWGKLNVCVGEGGKLVCRLNAKRLGQKQITHGEVFPELEGTTAEIAILPIDSSQIRDKSVLSQSSLRAILKEWGGVFVRYNGARVFPYGEPQNDWLRIDYDRGLRKGATEYSLLAQFAKRLEGVRAGRELLNMLSSRNYVGDVEVCSTNPYLFDMKASREGFVGDRGMTILRQIIRFAIDWSSIYRDYYLRLEEKDKTERAQHEFEQATTQKYTSGNIVEKAVDVVKRQVKQFTAHLPESDRDASRVLLKATDVILQRDKSTREELRHLRLIASTSSLLLIFSHEVKSVLSNLDTYAADLRKVEKQITGPLAQIVNSVQCELSEMKLRFIDLLKMTSLMSVDSKSSAADNLALASRIQQAVKCYDLVLKSYKIKVDFSNVANHFKTGEMLEAELYAILLNSLSNSIKSVIAYGKEKNIQFDAVRDNGGVLLSVSDTGMGLDVFSSEDLFVPFVADPTGKLYKNLERKLNPEDGYIVGTGSGLGLSIIKEIVSARNGYVRFAEPEKGWNARLEVFLG